MALRHQSGVGSRPSESAVGIARSILLVLPSIVWIALDRQLFGGDQSGYGTTSIRLFRTLTEDAGNWMGELLRAEPHKGPGIAWIGQFFVPLGDLIGSIDDALVLSVCLVHALGVWLVYMAMLETSGGRRAVAVISALAMSSAPLFVGLSHQFFTEAFQLLGTCFFVRVLSQAERLPAAVTLSRLWLASLYILAARASSPVFVVVLGPTILFRAFAVARRSRDWGWRSREVRPNVLAGVAATALVGFWYQRNLGTVVAHVERSTGSGAWGRKDTHLSTLGYWLDTALHGFFRTEFLALYLLLVVWGAWRLRGAILAWIGAPRLTPSLILTLTCAAQIVVTLLVFSMQANRLERLLLPLWPCIVVLVGASAIHLAPPALVKSMLAAFALQFGVVHASVFGVSWLPPYPSWYVAVLYRDLDEVHVMKEVVKRTCSKREKERYLNIIAVDSTMWGDWFGPVPAGYAAAKRYGLRVPCSFDYAGARFFGMDPEATWSDIEARDVEYVVTNDPTIYPPPPETMNRALKPATHPRLLQLIEQSGQFVKEPMTFEPGIWVFRRDP